MPNRSPQILLVESDLNLGYLLMENLRSKGYQVSFAKTETEGIAILERERQTDLCILDMMLPKQDGFAVAAHLKKAHAGLPFIFLSARNREDDMLHGFASGAEDFIVKPFSCKELHCRLQVILRRYNKALPVAEDPDSMIVGNLRLNAAKRELYVSGKEHKLSRMECNLLELFMHHADNYLTRGEILLKLWGSDDYFTAKSMDVYLCRIRKLIKDDSSVEIENLYGVGYRLRLKAL